MAWVLAALAAGALTALALPRLLGGPLGMLPGGRLSGQWGPPVKAWDFVAAEPTVELETNPEAPRSVTVWSVVWHGDLYVSADFLTPWKRWPHQVLRDPRVVVRVGQQRWRRRAVRVTDEGQIAGLRGAFAEKYALKPDGLAARTEVWFFRLEEGDGPP